MIQQVSTNSNDVRQDANGAIRVADSNVLLDVVVREFLNGESSESIAENYSTLTLADVYAAIAFYLRNREEVDAYLAERAIEAAELRKKIEAAQPNGSEVRRSLLARRAARLAEKSDASRS